MTDLYAIISDDHIDSVELRTRHRPAHVARLETLKQEGRLLLAGPFPKYQEDGFLGSLIVARFPSLEQARQWAEQDPFLLNGVYAHSEVRPFRKTMP